MDKWWVTLFSAIPLKINSFIDLGINLHLFPNLYSRRKKKEERRKKEEGKRKKEFRDFPQKVLSK
ncbi:MAG: hypothetical protein F6K23_21470 [Okeania sp. SIO2C9]|uniref:hypothetical protein n=1 Tax=Okeania sp. SIO2C9 TaxID=2607791 RepID=UPI0013C0D010|nr:hypothetical protein [Okeania sp. SIO2C9]NEQ75391.1 hypothetical protein [Okeania sp. SIO2C9]